MKNEEIKELCIDLATAESEEEVVDILAKKGFWNDLYAWENYDKNPNNFSTIGNQQSNADSALVEKIVNSVDAVLMRECQRRGIKPDSSAAPRSITEALKEYFGIDDGKLSNIDASQRTKIAQNILLVATGKKSNPCYSIIDFGEGQTPKRMTDTFLSLNKNNKLNIQFVQGKFNMGGTGVLRFCSKNHNLQLIISRRDPQIANREKDDETRNKWGFTIVRRENPRGREKNSSFRYLAPGGKVLMFEAEKLPLLPGDYPQPYGRDFEYGTFIKLYEYQLSGLKTIIKFDLYYRLAFLLPNIALPITLYERRKGYTSESYHIVMAGLSVRLDDDKSENLEEDFPTSHLIKVLGQEMNVRVYVFKKGKREHYAKKEGIIFTINGQTHASLPQSFFERKNVGMSYIADSILIMVDCSNFDRRTQEDLFMNSRDRLAMTEIRSEIEERLEELVKTHEGLRELNTRRRQEEIENKVKDSTTLANLLEDIIRKSPTLSKLLGEGTRIPDPFNLQNVKTARTFMGKKFPTYFRLSKNYPQDKPKKAFRGRRFRIQFETDAENDYFSRDREPGEFSIRYNSNVVENYSLNLWNGIATLSVTLPESINKGDILFFQTETTDSSRAEPFYNEFYVEVVENICVSGGVGERKEPAGDEESSLAKRKKTKALNLPNTILLRKSDENWKEHFKEDEDALDVKYGGEETYDFYINLDNKFLLTEIKNAPKKDPQIAEEKFKIGMVMVGMALLHYFNRRTEEDSKKGENEESIYSKIFSTSKALAPFLLPMISYLGELENSNLS